MATPVHHLPAFSSPSEVLSATPGTPIYARAHFPDGHIQDGKITRWSPTHVLLTYEPVLLAGRDQIWLPTAWTHRIRREESSWTDPYD